MAKMGKIAVIPKTYSKSFNDLESSLASAGYSRFPGTSRTFLPYREGSKYRTGLDVHAAYLNRLGEEEKKAEIERINEDIKFINNAMPGVDLSPTSPFWNLSSDADPKVTPVKLGGKDEYFDLNDVNRRIAWAWLRVHPAIAPSFQAYQSGNVSPDTQYYVCDEEIEQKIQFQKKQQINQAIALLGDLTPTKKRQIARLMGLPVSEDSKEETVYNLLDELIKQQEFVAGEHRGQSTVKMFTELATLKEGRLEVKDLVELAIKNSVYRVRTGGTIYEGENKVAQSKDDLVAFLLDENNQEDLLALGKKVNIKLLSKV